MDHFWGSNLRSCSEEQGEHWRRCYGRSLKTLKTSKGSHTSRDMLRFGDVFSMNLLRIWNTLDGFKKIMSKSTTPPQNPLATPQLPHNCACCFSNSARRSDSARCCLHSSWSRTGSNAARPFSEGLRRIDNIEFLKRRIYIYHILYCIILQYIYIYYDII